MMVDDADSVQLPHAFSTRWFRRSMMMMDDHPSPTSTPTSPSADKGAPALVLASDLAKIVGKTPDEIFGLYPQLYRRQATATEVAAMRRSHQVRAGEREMGRGITNNACVLWNEFITNVCFLLEIYKCNGLDSRRFN